MTNQIMTFPGHNADLFRWRRPGKYNTSTEKMHLKNDDIDQWRKHVEMASEVAVSEVLYPKKPHSGTNCLAVGLQSPDQLKDHNDACSEAQALLDNWLSIKLELEMDEDDLRSPVPVASLQPMVQDYSNFDDLYDYLAEEEEHSTIDNVLQGLIKQKLLDSEMMEQLTLDVGQTKKKFRDPVINMEARRQLVRENKARRDAERQRQQREKEAQRAAREEARRRERQEEMRKNQEARRQEEMIQQEMVRLRRQREEQRCMEQLARQREREGQRSVKSPPSAPLLPTKQQWQQDPKQLHKEQQIQIMLCMHNIKCLQKHFSGWYSVVLNQRLRMGKAMALCDWKRQLRAWRAWRAVVWAEQKQREVARTEEELRAENRHCQLAVESDRKRLLQRCLIDWQLWCRTQREQRELLAQQQETRRKMAALISAATTGKLKATETPAYQAAVTPTKLPEARQKEDHHGTHTVAPDTPVQLQNKTHEATAVSVAQPTQPWQVSRRHVAPTAAELHKAQQRDEDSGFAYSKCTAAPGSQFEHRHAVQQQIITQQRKLLREQQVHIAQLKQQQSMMGLKLEAQNTAQLIQQSSLGGSKLKSLTCDPTEQRALRVTGQPDSQCTPPRKTVTRQTCPHPIITAMETRAHERAERRKEIQELKRKREEEKLAEMKAAEEQRQREEEEEKRRAAEKRREEKRQERERKEEKQRQQQRQQELTKVAHQHYYRASLLRRGLAPWKRLIQLRRANIQLAESHHNLFLLRQCTLAWQQSARASLSEKEASADQLHKHFLLRRSLSCWKRLMDWRTIQEEKAENFHRIYTLRRVLLALLNHVTQERLQEWDRKELAQEHNSRRVLRRCFLAWSQLPCLLRKEREREERRRKLSRIVAEVVPEFRSHLL